MAIASRTITFTLGRRVAHAGTLISCLHRTAYKPTSKARRGVIANLPMAIVAHPDTLWIVVERLYMDRVGSNDLKLDH